MRRLPSRRSITKRLYTLRSHRFQPLTCAAKPEPANFHFLNRLGCHIEVCVFARVFAQCVSAICPPYCSKYNPIDHRLFCHLTRSLLALQLTSIDVIYDAFGATTTSTGLRVVCEKARKQYASGIKATAQFHKNEPTIRDEKLSKYNYKFSPN